MGQVTNADGLTWDYGVSEGEADNGGKLNVEGQYSKVVIDFDYADLAATGTEGVMSEVVLPDNAFIKSAELLVTTAFVGATATLTIGLIQASDRSTAIDADGIDVAIAVTAIDAIGDTITCDGALIGTAITESGLVTMTEGTAAFTAGVGKLTIEYFHTA